MHELNGKESLCNGGEQCEEMSESVASTDDDPADSGVQESHKAAPVIKTKIQKPSIEISHWEEGSKMVLILFSIILVVFTVLKCSDGWAEGDHLVPT